jgi:tetratricopeptide (TPR) repeat protein
MAGEHPDSAAAFATEAIALLEADSATSTLQYAAAVQLLADAQIDAGQLREAVATFDRLAAQMAREGRGETIGALSVISDETTALIVLGEIVRADSLLRDGMRRSAQMDTLDRIQPVMAMYYANTSLLMGRLDSAQALYRRMARVAERLDRPDLVQRAWFGAARSASLAGDVADARQAVAAHRAANARLPKPRRRDDWIIEGLLHLAEGKLQLGRQDLDEALRVDGYFGGTPKPSSRPILASAAPPVRSRWSIRWPRPAAGWWARHRCWRGRRNLPSGTPVRRGRASGRPCQPWRPGSARITR